MPPRARWAVLASAAVLAVVATLAVLRGARGPGTPAPGGIAHLTTAFGEVNTRSAGAFTFRPGVPGEDLAAGDSVKTGEASRAVVTYVSGSEVHVDPASLVVVVDQEDPSVRALRLESGAVAGEIPAGAEQPGTISVTDPAGGPLARITRLHPDEELSFRVRMLEEESAEVSILRGDAEVSRRGQAVRVRSGEAVDLPRAGSPGEVVALPAYPDLREPEVDARLELAEVPTGAVRLRWDRARGAGAYRVQVALQRGAGFEFTAGLVVDKVVNELELDFVPTATGTYAWRVSGLDRRGREGEFGFARRFLVQSIRPDPLPADAPADPVEARVSGAIWSAGAPAPSTLAFGTGTAVEARRSGRLDVAGSALELSGGAGLEVTALRRIVEHLRAVVSLSRGSLYADVPEAALLNDVQVLAGAATIRIAGGARDRVEMRAGLVRVICDRGESEVAALGRSVRLSAGEAVDVGADGPGVPMRLPEAPDLLAPAAGAQVPAGAVRFTWNAVRNASRYRLVVTREDGTTAEERSLAGSEALVRLPVGAFRWRVTAVSAAGLEGPGHAAAAFEVKPASRERPPRPPPIAILQPAAGATVTTDFVDLVGTTAPGVQISINAQPVDVDVRGTFRARVPLQPGPNAIEVSAQDATGRSSSASLRVRREVP